MALPLYPRDFAFDADTGDLIVGADLSFLSDGDAIKQACRLALELFLGEWFLDGSIGVPYYEEILVKAPNLPAIRAIFRKKLLAIVGVLDVISINLSYDNAARKLSVSWRVLTDFGELTGEV